MLSRKTFVLGFFLLSFTVGGCSTKPELAQVPSNIKSKKINTAESAQKLREKYGN